MASFTKSTAQKKDHHLTKKDFINYLRLGEIIELEEQEKGNAWELEPKKIFLWKRWKKSHESKIQVDFPARRANSVIL